MLLSKVLDKKIKNVFMQIFNFITLTEHPKKAREISVKLRKSVREFSVKFDMFSKSCREI